MTDTPPPWQRSLPSAAIGIVLVVAVLMLAKPVVVPLALALTLTFVLAPVVAAVQKLVVKRGVAVLLTCLLSVLIVGSVGWVVTAQIQDLAVEVPRHKQDIREKLDRLRGAGGGPFSELLKMVQDLTEGPVAGGDLTLPAESGTTSEVIQRPVVLAQPKESGMSRIIESVVPVVEPLATVGLVAILVVFMLASKEDIRDRVLGLAGYGQLSATSRAMEDAAGRVGRYLLSLLAVNVSFGLLFAIGLWLIGVPFAFLWGFLASILRFIPFLGTWAAASFPIILSVALSPGWAQPLQVFAFFLVLDLVTANIVEPLLFGHGTGVSPIALLVAAAFWAWVWGPIGLLLATPLTVCLVVLGQHVPRLGFLALLLGNAPALPPPARLYQRLFARDEMEAGERVAEHAAEFGLENAFDDMVVPALVMARRERTADALTAEGEEFALTAVRRIIASLGKNGADAPTDRVIVACPAHHPSEEPTLDMLAQLIRPDKIRLDALSTKSLPVDVAARVAEVEPAAVFISVLPPGGLAQAAYLCRLLRRKFPGLTIIVGWWGSERQFDKMLVKFRKAGASYVTTSLRQTCTQIKFVAQSVQTRADNDTTTAADRGVSQ